MFLLPEFSEEIFRPAFCTQETRTFFHVNSGQSLKMWEYITQTVGETDCIMELSIKKLRQLLILAWNCLQVCCSVLSGVENHYLRDKRNHIILKNLCCCIRIELDGITTV